MKNLIFDQIIRLVRFYSSNDYPDKRRRMKFVDKVNRHDLIFLTNSFTISTLTVKEFYKWR